MMLWLRSAAFNLFLYLVTALGMLLRRAGMIGDGFLRDASRLVFNLSAPTMLFLSLAKADIEIARAARMNPVEALRYE